MTILIIAALSGLITGVGASALAARKFPGAWQVLGGGGPPPKVPPK